MRTFYPSPKSPVINKNRFTKLLAILVFVCFGHVANAQLTATCSQVAPTCAGESFGMLSVTPGGGIVTLLSEDFSSAVGTTPPAGWTSIQNLGDPGEVWAFDNPSGLVLNAPITDPAAIFDSDFWGSNGPEDIIIESPTFDASTAAVLTLNFDEWYRGIGGCTATAEVWDGAAWNIVLTHTTVTTPDPNVQSIDITTAAGGSAVAKVRFRFIGNFSWWWTIDNVQVTGENISYLWSPGAGGQTTQTATGLAAGTYTVTVTDNIAAATTTCSVDVTSVPSPTGTASATDASCFGFSDGTATANATGGTTIEFGSPPVSGSILITEVSNWRAASDGNGGPWPFDVGSTFDDFVEITNITTSLVDVSGVQVEVVGGSAGTFIFPGGTIIPGGGVAVIRRSTTGAGDPSNLFFEMGLFDVGSGTSVGVILSNGGVVLDAVAYNTFAIVGTGTPAVSATDWSGSGVGPTSGTSGIHRVVATDNNADSDWAVVSGGDPTSPGVLDAILTIIPHPNPTAPGYTYLWDDGQTNQTATGLIAGTYTVFFTDANGCVGSATTTIGQPAVVPNATASDATRCGAGNVDLMASGSGNTLVWFSSTGLDTLGTGNPFSVNVTATGYFLVKEFDGTCYSEDADTAFVTVQPPVPVVLAVSDTLFCDVANPLVTFGASSADLGYSYAWSQSSTNGGLTAFTGNSTTAMPTETTTYTLTSTSGICGDVQNVTVTFGTNPVISVATSVATICLGESVELTSDIVGAPEVILFSEDFGSGTCVLPAGWSNTGPENYQFSTTGPNHSVGSDHTNPGTGCYAVHDDSGLATALDDAYLETPSIDLSAYIGVELKFWMWNDEGGGQPQSEMHIDVSTDGGVTFTSDVAVFAGLYPVWTEQTVDLTDYASATLVVRFRSEESVSFFSDMSLDDILITGKDISAYTFAWSPAAEVTNPASNSTIATPVSTGTNTYQLNVTNLEGCSGTASVNVEVLSIPLPPIADYDTVCGVQSTTLNAVAQGGGTLNWYDASSTLVNTGPTFITPLITDTIEYYVAENNGFCDGIFDTVCVILELPDSIFLSASDDSLCGLETITLTATTLGNYSFTWTETTGGGLAAGSGSTITASPTQTATYTVTGVDGDCIFSTSITVIVSDSPVISTATDRNTICDSESAQLSVSLDNAGVLSDYSVSSETFALRTPVGPTTVNLGDDASSASQPIGFAFNFYGNTYTDFFIASNGYIQFSSPLSLFGASSIPNTAAPNDYIALMWADLNPAAGGTISYWTEGTAPNRVLVVEFNAVPWFGSTTTNTGQIHLFESSNEIQLHSASIATIANATQGIENISGSAGVAVPGRNFVNGWTATNDAFGYAPIFVGIDASTTTYSWSPTASLDDPNSANPTASPTSTTTYTVVGTTEFGCTDTAMVTVNVVPTPLLAPLGVNDTTCGPGFVALNATAPGGGLLIWYTDETGGTVVGTGNPFYTPVISTTTDYWVTEFNGICEGPRTKVTAVVELAPLPVTATATPSIVCNPGTVVSLQATSVNPLYTYIWAQLSPAGGLVSPLGQNTTAIPTGAATYVVQAAHDGCVATDTVSISFGAVPVLTVSAADLIICEGDSTQLNVDVDIPAQFIPPTITNFEFEIFDGASDGICCGFGIGNYTVTAGGVVVASGGDFGASELTAFSTLSGNSIDVDILTDNFGGETSWELRDASGTVINSVAGGTLPSATAIPTNSVIAPAPPADESVTYLWTPSTGADDTEQSPIAAPASTTIYTVLVTSAQGCTATGTVEVQVIAPAPAPVCEPDTTICGVQSLTLSATGTGGTLNWYRQTAAPVPVTLLSEDFSTATGTTPPAGWTSIQNAGAPGEVWAFDNPSGLILNTPITDPAAIFDSDFWGSNGAEDIVIESPTFDASTAATVTLTFDEWYRGIGGCTATAEVWDGAAWNIVLTHTTVTTPDPNVQSIDITTAAGGSAVAKVRFRFIGNFSWWWIVDNVTVSGVLPPGAVFVGSGNTFTTPPITETTTFLVAENNGYCDGVFDTCTVTFISADPVTAVATPSVVCEGDTIVLNAISGTAYNYTWSGPGLISTTGSTTTAVASNDATYTVMAENGICVFETTVDVLVNKKPVVTVTATPPTICVGETSQLEVTASIPPGGAPPTIDVRLVIITDIFGGETSYSLVDNTAASTLISISAPASSTQFIHDFIVPTSNDLTFTINDSFGDGFCCGFGNGEYYIIVGGDTVAVSNASQNPFSSSTQSENFPAGSLDLTYLWIPSTNLSANNIANPVFTGSSTTTYEVFVTTPAGCTNSASVSIGVVAVPNAPVAVNTTLCGAGAATISATGGTGGGTFDWYDAASGGNLLQSNTAADFTTAVNGDTTFYVEINNGICSGPRVPVTVTALPSDPVVVTIDNAFLCGPGTVNLNATVTGTNAPYTYSWAATTGGNLLSNNTASVSATPTQSATYTLTVSYTDAFSNTCQTIESIDVFVSSIPVLTTSASPAAICDGLTSQLNVDAVIPVEPTPVSFTFEIFDAFSDGICCGFGNGNYTVTAGGVLVASGGSFGASEATSFTTLSGNLIEVDVLTDNFGGETTWELRDGSGTVIKSAGPFPSNTQLPTDVTVAPPPPPTFTYLWTPATGLSANNIANPVFSGTATTTYTVVVTSPAGCTETATVTVTVLPTSSKPIVSDASRCGIGPVHLTASGDADIIWLDGIPGNVVATGTDFTPIVTDTTYYYVFSNGTASALTGGFANPFSGPLFDVNGEQFNNGMFFTVDNPAGILLESIDVWPTADASNIAGVSIMNFQIKDSAFSTTYLSVIDTVATPGSPQTVDLNIYLPQGSYVLDNSGNTQLMTNGSQNLGFLPAGVLPIVTPGELSIQGVYVPPPPASNGPAIFQWYWYFYNWQFTGGCLSDTAEICVAVDTPGDLVILGDTSYCESGAIALTGSGSTYSEFFWSPATGLNTTTGTTVLASPTETTTYTLYAHDGDSINGCSNVATHTVYVFNPPLVDIDDIPLDTVCIGTPVPLNVVASRNEYALIGDEFNPSNATVAPYNGANPSIRSQFLITGAELNAGGLTGGNITCMAFNVFSKNSLDYYQNFTISLQHTTNTSIGAGFVTGGFTQVFLDSIQTTIGWNEHTFDTEFAYDGTSNLLVEICFTNTGIPGGFDRVYATPTTFNSATSPAALGCGTATAGAPTNLRPNIRFCGGVVNYAWSPNPDLSDLTSADPIVTPVTVGLNTYYVTVTDPLSGCTAVDSIQIFADTIPLVPTATILGDSLFCNTGSTQIEMTGSSGTIQWQMSTDNTTWTDIPGADASILNTGALTQTTYFRVQITCISDTLSNVVTVTVFNPAILSTITDTICGTAAANLSATANTGIIAWYNNIGDLTPAAYGATYNPFVTQTDTFYVSAFADTSLINCESARVPVVVRVIPIQSIIAFATNPVICDGESTTLQAASLNSNFVYTWEPGTLVGASQTVTPPFIPLSGIITYTVTGVDPTNGCVVSVDVPVLVNQTPDLSITQVPDPVCEGDSVQLNVTATTLAFRAVPACGEFVDITINTDDFGGETTWELRDANTTALLASGGPYPSNTTIVASICVPVGTDLDFTIFDAFSDGICCDFGIGSYDVSILGTSYASGAVFGASETSLFTVPVIPAVQSVSLAATYAWSPTTGVNDPTSQNPKILVTGPATYYVTVTDPATGCSSVDSITIIPAALPMATFGIDSLFNCGSGATLTLTDTGAYAGGYPAGTTFDWYQDGFLVTTTNVPSLFIFGFGQYQVVITTPEGCSANSDVVQVNLNPDLPIAVGTAGFNGTAPSVVTDATCFGTSTGQIAGFGLGLDINVTQGGLIPYDSTYIFRWYDASNTLLQQATYQWTSYEPVLLGSLGLPFGELFDTLSNIPAGTYTMEIWDSRDQCFGSATFTVNEPPELVVVLDTSLGNTNNLFIECSGSPIGAIDITAFGGNNISAPYDYLWSNGETTQDISALTAGTYTVTVTDSLGCETILAVVVDENSNFVVGTSQSNALCNGSTDGSATVFVSGGVAPYTYLWDDPNAQTGQTAFNLAAGSATVTVTDALGCDTVVSFVITQPAILDATASTTNVTCFGANNGTATITSITGGTPPYNVIWNPFTAPVNAMSISGLAPGTYQAQVFDANGCVTNVVVTITGPNPLACVPSVVPASCIGANDGKITLVVSGGTAPYSFAWSNGDSTAISANLIAGTYTVTITDANGCTKVETIFVPGPSPIVTNDVVQDISCFGANDGKIIVQILGGGTPPYSYSWNTVPAQTTNIASNLSAGTYSLIITDGNGCNTVLTYTVNEPDELMITSFPLNVTCNGTSTGVIGVLPSGGVPPYSLLWSNGNSTNSNTGLSAGTYTLTVTDASGCIKVETYTLTEPTAIALSAVIGDATCNGSGTGSIVLTAAGGTPGYTYLWSNNETTSTIGNLLAGTYMVTVTDAANCSAVQSFVVGQPAVLSMTASVNNVSCFGGSDGSATANPSGGTAPYTYLWSNNQVTQTANGLSAGAYVVTITDVNGCIKIGNVTVGQPAELICTALISNVSCNGGSSGSVAVTASGGVAPYTYLWNTVPAQTTALATGLSAGSYVVLITDANGCTIAKTVTVTDPTPITITTSKRNVSCKGGFDGTATAVAQGGTPPYSYSWNTTPVSTTGYVSGLNAGFYQVTVTDANGCIGVSTVEVREPTTLLSFYIPQNPTCAGTNTGSINLLVTGGVAPYTFLWSTGATTEDISGIGAGIYYAMITDKNGCASVAIIYINDPVQLALSTSTMDASCTGAPDGMATVFATGGSTPYSYNWSNGQTGPTAINLAGGTYTVTVTDSKGCSAITSATVDQSAGVTCGITVLDSILCAGDANGKLQAVATGGTGPFTYIWNTNPVQTTAIVANLGPGTYSVVITDATGCSSACTYTITEPAALACAVTSTDVSCAGGANGTATVSASGGTQFLQPVLVSIFSEDFGASGCLGGQGTFPTGWTNTGADGWEHHSGSIGHGPTSGRGGSGCYAGHDNSGTGDGFLTSPSFDGSAYSNLSLSFYAWNKDAAVGEIHVNVSTDGGTTFPNQNVLVVNSTHQSWVEYSVDLTPYIGSTMAIQFEGIDIQGNGAFAGDPSIDDISVTSLVGVIQPPYTYAWSTSPVQTTSTATGLSAGNYVVIVTDGNGCTTSCNVTVNEPAALASTITSTDLLCNGDNSGTATVNVTGGTLGAIPLLTEDFNGCALPAGWANVGADNFFFNSSIQYGPSSGNGGSGCFAGHDNSGGPANALLNTPSIDASGLTNLSLSFYAWNQLASSGELHVNVSTDGGTTFTQDVLVINTNVTSWTQFTVDLTPYISASTMVQFEGVDLTNFTDDPSIDDVVISTLDYNYAWSNGQLAQTATDLSAGTYTVVYTDANGCMDSATVTVSEPTALSMDPITSSNVSCFGANDGSATVSNVAGGMPPYVVEWNTTPAQFTSTAVGLAAGTHTATITDQNGCVLTDSVIITEPASALVAVIDSVTGVPCAPGGGYANVAASGGTPPYTYLWSNGQITGSATNLTAGTHVVTVTDANGCEAQTTVIIGAAGTLSLSVVATDALCNGDSSGTADVTTSGGAGSLSYAFIDINGDTISTVNPATNLPAGYYTVVVTDAGGCTASESFGILEPSPMLTFTSGTNSSCAPLITTFTNVVLSDNLESWSFGNPNGTASYNGWITPTGSSTPDWTVDNNGTSSGGTGPDFDHTLFPVANNGGKYVYLETSTSTIADRYLVSPVMDLSSYNAADLEFWYHMYGDPADMGTLSVDVSTDGSTWTPSSFSISGVQHFSDLDPWTQATVDISAVAGSPTAQIRFVGNHIASFGGDMAIDDIEITAEFTILAGGDDGTATVFAFGGAAPTTYLWSNGQTTQTATGLQPGTYTVIVTDANGCSTVADPVVITSPDPIALSITSTSPLCYGGSSGSLTAVVDSGGAAPFSFNWSNGQNTATASGLFAGTYTVTVTDWNGCSNEASVTLVAPDSISCTSVVIEPSCNGANDGSAVITATGGTPYQAAGVEPYTYSWQNGVTIDSIGGITAGNWFVTITDSVGCSWTKCIKVGEPTELICATGATDVLCNGDLTGSVNLTVSGGSPFTTPPPVPVLTPVAVSDATEKCVENNLDSQSWALNVSAPGATVAAGSVQLAMDLYHSWKADVTITLTSPSATVAIIKTDDTGSSNDLGDGVAGSTSNGTTYGIPPTYTFGDGLGGGNIDVLAYSPPGSYDPASPFSVFTGEPADGIWTLTISDDAGGDDGCIQNVTLSMDGLTFVTGTLAAPYTYSWSNGATTEDLTGVAAGTYTVTVTDGNGCSTICSSTVNEPDAIVVNATVIDATCGDNGSVSASVSGGVAPYSYNWSDGQATATASALAAGTYTLVVTDANGCTNLSGYLVNAGAALTCDVAAFTGPSCTGYSNGTATVNATGGSGTYTYSWSTTPTQTTAAATGLPAGTYFVTVTDAGGCSSTCSVILVDPAPLSLSVQIGNNACIQDSANVVALPSGGTVPYTYVWSNGYTAGGATTLTVGSHAVTVTDANGCDITQTITITPASAMTCGTSSTNSSCGSANGTAQVNVAGGIAPFTYSWNSTPIQTTAIATGLPAGTYTVVVTDANGCTTECNATIQEPAPMSTLILATDVTCNGGNDGAITLSNFNGGQSPFTFLWSNAATTMNLTGVAAGTYSVTITDAIGCTFMGTATVGEADAIVLATSGVDASCNGYLDGAASVSASGGNGPYTYLWSTGANVSAINMLAAGTYYVTVMDANGCVMTDSVAIADAPAMTYTVTADSAACGSTNGTATITVSGGAGGYTYSWNTVPVQTTAMATGLAAGSWFVTVTDANGCDIVICAKVPSLDGPNFVLNTPTYIGGDNIRCNGANDGTIDLIVITGGPATYMWDDGTTDEDRSNLGPGTYTVTATNVNCSVTQTITLTEPDAIVLTTSMSNVNCNGGNNGIASVTAAGGNAPYAYLWSDGQNTATAINLAAGNYTVIVTDGNGCSATAAISISQPASAIQVSGVISNVSCKGGSDGAIDMTVSGGTPPYGFLWHDGSTMEDISGLAAGAFTLTVTDAAGCALIYNGGNITEPALLVCSASSADVTCAGANDGSASASGAGGTAPYTYAWSNGSTMMSLSGLAAGTYDVTVTDANGCSTMCSAVVGSPDPMVITASGTDASSAGASDGIASVTNVTGGNAPYTYSWNTNPIQTTAAITGLIAGTYQVTVQDLAGCVELATVVVNQPPIKLINPFSGLGFEIKAYPNPTHGNLNIEMTSDVDAQYELTVRDLTGRIMHIEAKYMDIGINYRSYDFSSFAKGVYYVRVEIADYTETIKVIVQ